MAPTVLSLNNTKIICPTSEKAKKMIKLVLEIIDNQSNTISFPQMDEANIAFCANVSFSDGTLYCHLTTFHNM